MTIPNYLVAAADAPERLVYEVARTLFESRTDIARTVPAAALLDRRQAIFTSPLPLHQWAAKYLRREPPLAAGGPRAGGARRR
ncbi:TAXI family TRAP transporter solute-binding subunit [Leucobacter komagatae]|uniref:TAXI family TRAP transporter solute-binding subunit n=1 Tax=Leucobacter komagatae TaxID=55969 RepID=UPI0024821644|nr:TAXI family TRAP transporter solute-binding subunit [Leucobacter komagatae]